MIELLFDETADREGKLVRDSLSAVEVLDQGSTLFLATDEPIGGVPSIERLRRTGENSFAHHERFALADFIDLPAPPKKSGETEEVDLEGLREWGGYLWFVGSYSSRRRKPKSEGAAGIAQLARVENGKNRALLGCIPLVSSEAGARPVRRDGSRRALTLDQDLREVLREDTLLGPFVRPFRNVKGKKVILPGKDNGFDIEGITVVAGPAGEPRVFVGLRGPVLRGFAVLLELEFAPLEGAARLVLRQNAEGTLYRRHLLPLEGLGVRDLCRVEDDLWILAGPTMTLRAPVDVFRWRDFAANNGETLLLPGSRALEKVGSLPSQLGRDNAEGLACLGPTPSGSALEFLAVYDSPAEERKRGRSATTAERFMLGDGRANPRALDGTAPPAKP